MRTLVEAGFEREAVTLYESFWVKPGLLEQLTGYSWGDKASLGLDANICDMERVQKQFWAEQATLFIGGFDKLDNQLRKAAFIADRWDKVINGRGKRSISLESATRKMLEVSKAHSMLRYQNPFHQKQFLLAVEGELQTYLSSLFFGSKTRTKDAYFGAFVESLEALPDDMSFTSSNVRFIRV